MNFFKFNKIYIIESLKDERLTGQELYNDIIKIRSYSAKVASELFQIHSLKEWEDLLDKIVDEIKTQNIIPILHLELHGSNKHDGLILSNHELITWRGFLSDMRRINILTENNLFVTMGICFGMEILYSIQLNEPAPFFCIIGSLYELCNDDIYIRYSDFYDEFLQSFNFTKSLQSLYKANPDLPNQYSFVNAPELFRRVYENYLNTQFSSEAIKKRVDDSIPIFEKKKGSPISPQERDNFKYNFEQKLLDKKDLYFREHIDSFLMRNKFDSCKTRFAVPQTSEEFLSFNWSSMMPNVIN